MKFYMILSKIILCQNFNPPVQEGRKTIHGSDGSTPCNPCASSSQRSSDSARGNAAPGRRWMNCWHASHHWSCVTGRWPSGATAASAGPATASSSASASNTLRAIGIVLQDEGRALGDPVTGVAKSEPEVGGRGRGGAGAGGEGPAPVYYRVP